MRFPDGLREFSPVQERVELSHSDEVFTSRDTVMKLSEIRDVLRCEVLAGEDDLSMEVETVVASDGMSEILAFARPGALMITGLTNVQSVRTADIANVRAIVYIRGKRPDKKAMNLARESQIPVLATRLGMFDVCGILREQGLKGGM
jgi:predicted transcriptional regulator